MPTSPRKQKVRPVQEPATGQATIREEPAPEPVVIPKAAETSWSFSTKAPAELRWSGEGERCDATFPPGVLQRSVQCELVAGHWADWPWHSAQRSSV